MHVQYESPITSGKKVMAQVKVFQKYVELQGQGHTLLYHVEGPVIGNTHMKYESSIFIGLKVMAKVKVFVYAADADGRAMTLAPRTVVPTRLKVSEQENETST